MTEEQKKNSELNLKEIDEKKDSFKICTASAGFGIN